MQPNAGKFTLSPDLHKKNRHIHLDKRALSMCFSKFVFTKSRMCMTMMNRVLFLYEMESFTSPSTRPEVGLSRGSEMAQHHTSNSETLLLTPHHWDFHTPDAAGTKRNAWKIIDFQSRQTNDEEERVVRKVKPGENVCGIPDMRGGCGKRTGFYQVDWVWCLSPPFSHREQLDGRKCRSGHTIYEKK